ncbi:MAG: DUF4143 domain-containing protein [Propionibacteriaceae bacterium]|nr:DUF4143 domain-containing protein [Propionibacteriaceae bacterium]
MEYVPRIVDATVGQQLRAAGALLIRGPKGCGKTETGRRHSRSELDVEGDPRVATVIEVDPAILLQGDSPRLIDEWQQRPVLWNAVRREVDRRRAKGQFILTGSSTPRPEPAGGPRRHSGVGRFAILDMRTMSWRELGWASGDVTLAGLFAGAPITPAESSCSLGQLAERLVVGGWPANLGLSAADAQTNNANYFELLVEEDAARAWGVRRDAAKVRRALRSLARNAATECSLATLAADSGGADGPLSEETVAEYVNAFDALMVREDQSVWNTHIRSSARLRRRPKRHLADPSLCCAALGLGPDRLLQDLEYMGLLFESAVVHDLRVYAAALGGKVYHYRDSNGVEADAVVELPDGAWVGVEVKLGFGAVDAAAASLTRFAAVVDQSRVGAPAALIVVTGSGIAHRRNDGVTVAPFGLLG